MVRRTLIQVVTIGALGVTAARAQSTGTPSFMAPYRAFERSELGGTLSFPGFNNGVALEGDYRFGYKKFDLGIRSGFFDRSGLGSTAFLIGAEARTRVITHTEDFPMDGAIVFGLGGSFASGSSGFIIPGGLSLGRRFDLPDSKVSIVPYAQPTLFITGGDQRDTQIQFAFGIGTDFRLSRVLDARVSMGFGDLDGIAFSMVYVH